jgi:mannosyl-oligosaccharide glucosidase
MATILFIILSYGLQLTHATESEKNDASRLILETERASNQSLLWGPYRSNLYFGVRPRIPKSLMTGLLWAKVDDLQSTQESMYPRFPRSAT